MHAASALFKQHFCTLLHFCWNTRTCEVAIIEQQNVLPKTPPEMPFIINLSPATSKKQKTKQKGAQKSYSECFSLECCISILLKMSKNIFQYKHYKKTTLLFVLLLGMARHCADMMVKREKKFYPLGAVVKMLGQLYCLFAGRDPSVKQRTKPNRK